jgi:hypothetical protein
VPITMKSTYGIYGVIALALLLSGCAPMGNNNSSTPLPQVATKLPRYSDALAGLYPIPASSVPLDKPINYYAPGGGSGKPGRAVLTMALVPGANYQKMRDYFAQAYKDAKASVPGSAGTIQYNLRTDEVLSKAIEIVKQHYPWIQLTSDVATANKRNDSLTLVLDIRSRLGRVGGDPTAVQIELIAFDAQHKPITRFIGEGKIAAGGPDGYGFSKAANQALNALDTKSKTLFN